ncbi:hypothetical protein [Methylocella sp.]|uniref:hypothetical protein n=1 Tax=Methylocella sp. TaxID=1978226 RepID=UPI003783A746
MTGVLRERRSSKRGLRPSRLALAAAALSCLALAGCDRCGDPVKFNAPTFPKVCHGVPMER